MLKLKKIIYLILILSVFSGVVNINSFAGTNKEIYKKYKDQINSYNKSSEIFNDIYENSIIIKGVSYPGKNCDTPNEMIKLLKNNGFSDSVSKNITSKLLLKKDGKYQLTKSYINNYSQNLSSINSVTINKTKTKVVFYDTYGKNEFSKPFRYKITMLKNSDKKWIITEFSKVPYSNGVVKTSGL